MMFSMQVHGVQSYITVDVSIVQSPRSKETQTLDFSYKPDKQIFDLSTVLRKRDKRYIPHQAIA